MSGIVIVDRSVLSYNLLRLILKPKGFSCYSVQTVEQLKKLLTKKIEVRGVLINSNVFGESFLRDLALLDQDAKLKSLPKIFLSKPDDLEHEQSLSKISKGCVLRRPFHPGELYREVARWG